MQSLKEIPFPYKTPHAPGIVHWNYGEGKRAGLVKREAGGGGDLRAAVVLLRGCGVSRSSEWWSVQSGRLWGGIGNGQRGNDR